MILGFYGPHNSGKTTLIEKLIKELKSKGYSIATLKNIPREFSIDSDEKDTGKLKNAGSDMVVASSENETAFIFNKRMDFNEIISRISAENYDIIFVEGYKRQDIPKVKVGSIETLDNTVFEYNASNYDEIPDYIEKEIAVEKIYKKLPKINCKKCGYDCMGLAKLIFNKEKNYRDCVILSNDEGDLLIEVDGKKIWAGGFVKNTVKNVVFGLVSSLKGGEDAKEIKIKIKF